MGINVFIRVYEPLHKACSLSVSHAAEKKNENIKPSPTSTPKNVSSLKKELSSRQF